MLIRPTYAKVDLHAIKQNVKNIKASLSAGTLFCAVVKADGYGHGSVMAARAALEAGAEWLAVAISEEAKELRDAGIDAKILVLGPSNAWQWEMAAALDISMVAVSTSCIQNAAAAAQNAGAVMKLHVKVDTGMNRVGVKSEKEFAEMLDMIDAADCLKLEGLMTHFASADEADKSYTNMQAQRFETAIGSVKSHGHKPIVHAGNSGAALDCPQLHFDMVRVGIAMYGCYPSAEVQREVKLTPAMSLRTQISQIKTIEKGDKVSYGCTFTAPKQMRVATLPIGYADGFNRLLSSKGEVLIRGQRAPVIGRVCMDQTVVDVSSIETAQLHDEAVCIGRQNGDEISAEEFAAHCGTINYEVLCALSPRVPRLYVQDE